MAPPALRLDQALDAIANAALVRLEAATVAGGLLEGVTAVISGDRTRSRRQPPYVWLTVGRWTEEHVHAIHTKATATVLVAAFVTADEPEEGWLDSIRLAARARSVVLEGRTLGLDFVQEVAPVGGDPIGQIRQGRRFAASARLDVIFTIKEV